MDVQGSLYKVKGEWILCGEHLTRESFIERWLSMGFSILCHKDKTRKVLTKTPDLATLSPEDQQTVGWFHAEQRACDILGYDYHNWIHLHSKDKSSALYAEISTAVKVLQAQELSEHRNFTLEDMTNAFYNGWNYRGEPRYTFPLAKKEYLSHLKQPLAWRVTYEGQGGAYKILKVLHSL